jgi:protease I
VQDHELIYPYYRLLEENFEIFVALKSAKETTGILGTKIPSDLRCTIISYEALGNQDEINSYDLLILPGGAKCMEYLRREPIVLKFISDWNERGKIIGSICHGAQLLISAKVVKDKVIAGYYSIEDDIVNAGAYYNPTFAQDKNIISASHYMYLGEWMKLILEEFYGRFNSK